MVYLGCPHASLEEMKSYAELLGGGRVNDGAQLWITTNRWVRQMAQDAGILTVLERAGAKVISDTCPISCHFARKTSHGSHSGRRDCAVWSSSRPSRQSMCAT